MGQVYSFVFSIVLLINSFVIFSDSKEILAVQGHVSKDEELNENDNLNGLQRIIVSENGEVTVFEDAWCFPLRAFQEQQYQLQFRGSRGGFDDGLQALEYEKIVEEHPVLMESKDLADDLDKHMSPSASTQHGWIRYCYQGKHAFPIMETTVKDILYFVDPENEEDVFMALQQKQQPTTPNNSKNMWSLYRFLGFGAWFNKELEMILEMNDLQLENSAVHLCNRKLLYAVIQTNGFITSKRNENGNCTCKELLYDIEAILTLASKQVLSEVGEEEKTCIRPCIEESEGVNYQEILCDQFEAQGKGTEIWIRFYFYDSYLYRNNANLKLKDIILLVSPKNSSDAIIAIQSGDASGGYGQNQGIRWKAYLLEGYGEWLKKEIDLIFY